MAGIKIKNSDIVFRGDVNAPHLRNAFFPSVVEIADGRLIVAMDIGQRMETHDVRSYTCSSEDGGKTWTAPRRIFEPDTSVSPATTTCRISKTTDGGIVGLAGITDRSNGGLTVNSETDGHVETLIAILRSDDGMNWSPPELVTPPLNWPVLEVAAVILPLRAERWLWPTSLFLDWEGHCPQDVKGFVAISQDQGRTWPRTTDVFDFWQRKTVAWEQKLTRLSDGRILSVCWCYNTETKTNEPNRYALSADEGDSFGPPLDTPLQGQTCSVLGLEDNHVLAVYRRLDRPGLWAHLARIEDDCWLPRAEALLWGSEVSALDAGTSSSLRNLHKLRFGFPTLIRLADGDVFCVFWGLEEELMVIRALRLAVGV